MNFFFKHYRQLILGSLLLLTASTFWKADSLSQPIHLLSATTQDFLRERTISLPSRVQHSLPRLLPNYVRSPHRPSSLHRPPAPLQCPSEEELDAYPGAVVIEAIEIDGACPEERVHQRILKTDFRSSSAFSGLIRTEEVINKETGELIDRGEMMADHLLVSLATGQSPQEFLERFGRNGTHAVAISKVTQDGSLYDLTLSNGSLEALPEALEQINSIGWASAQADFMAHASGTISCNIPSYAPSFWYLENQWGLWKEHGGIDVYDAWERSLGYGHNDDAHLPIVAILDSGIRYTHEDLIDNIWSDPSPTKEGNLHGIDMISSNEASMDNGTRGHGTHLAGIIGGMGVSKNLGLERGIFGVAPKVQLMSCRFMTESAGALGVGRERDLITCMDYAIRHGATIVNCSFVMNQYLNPTHVTPNQRGDYDESYSSHHSDFLLQACQQAQQAGVIIVAAAGNAAHLQKTYSAYSSITDPETSEESTITQQVHGLVVSQTIQYNNDVHPAYPASYGVGYGLNNIISVAASDFSWEGPCEISSESNYGATSVQIAAPGCDILSTSNASDSSYITYSGTSMATAFVSGSLALLKEQYPQEPYETLVQHLLSHADCDPKLQGKIINQRHLNIGKALKDPVF